MRKPTIRDVAEEAGISVATVSRVLNNKPGYGPETGERVQQAIEKLGYQRNEIARNLKISKTNTIAIVVPTTTDSFFTKLIRGILKAARTYNYAVLLCDIGVNGKYSEEDIRMLAERQISGIIVCSISPKLGVDKLLNQLGIPAVFVNSISYNYKFPYIKIDDFQAMYSATSFLIGQGHREIAMISGAPDDVIAGRPRIEGYRHALREHHLPVREELEVVADNFSYEHGAEAFETLLQRGVSFTGLVTCSDEVAAAALTSAHRHGIRIPQNLSVVGFDGTATALLTMPQLTTVSQPFEEMGYSAIQMLLSEKKNSDSQNGRILQTKIEVRGSTQKLEG